MAISSSDISALTAFTDAELLISVNNAIVNVTLGGQATLINGRSASRADLSALRLMKASLENSIAAADSTSPGGLVLVQYGDRV